MAHVAKFTRGSIGCLTRHYERAKNQKTGEYIKFKNQEIDITKIHLNYNLAPNRNQLEFIKQRCKEANCLNRKDVNVMCDWVVTAPQGFPVENYRQLFEETYKFLVNRYGGEKNVISAYVHNDETTPHMHFSFIPIIFDINKGRETVSAKLVLNKLELKRFHPDLENYLSKVFGYEIGIMNEATKEGNRSIDELKKQSAIERLQTANKKAEQIISSAKSIVANNISQMQDEQNKAELKRSEMLQIAILEVQAIKDKLLLLQAEYDALNAFIEQSKKSSDISVMYPDYAKITEKGIFKKEEYVTVPKDKWEARHVSANQISALEKERQTLEKAIKLLQKSEPHQRIKTLEKKLENVQDLNINLKKELGKTQKTVNHILEVFEKNPDLARNFEQANKILIQTRNRNKER